MPRINDEHIITIDGKPYVKYGGLLETAHRSGLKDLQVKLIQSPSRENGYTAVCEATAVIKTRSRGEGLRRDRGCKPSLDWRS